MIVDSPNKERAKYVSEYLDDIPHLSDKVIVLGGDGSLLYAVHKHGIDNIYLPINQGTLGFLMNPNTEDSWAKIKSGQYSVYSFNLLHVKAYKLGEMKPQYEDFAVNDLYLERDSGQTVRLAIEINDSPIINHGKYLCADGIIVSTSLGSTAYSFSAGGQVSHPLVPLINMTPICPHLPKIPPMTLSVESSITIVPKEQEKRPVRMVIDGKTYRDYFSRVEVTRYKKRLKIAYIDGIDFTHRLVNKIVKRA